MIQFLVKVLKHSTMLKHINIKEVQHQIIGAMDIFKFISRNKFSIGIHIKFVEC
jgi:hypothetical protein